MRMMSADLKRAQHCWEASPAKASICVNSVSNWYASLGSRAIVFVLTHLTHIAYAYIAHYSKKSNFVYKFNLNIFEFSRQKSEFWWQIIFEQKWRFGTVCSRFCIYVSLFWVNLRQNIITCVILRHQACLKWFETVIIFESILINLSPKLMKILIRSQATFSKYHSLEGAHH